MIWEPGRISTTACIPGTTIIRTRILCHIRHISTPKVPIRHIHGDQDGTVPLEANSGELAKRYKALGGPIELEVVPGQGHNMWSGWFQSQPLTDFIIKNALPAPVNPVPKPGALSDS